MNSFLIFLPGTSERHIIHNILQHFMKTWYHFLWLHHILIIKKTRTYKQSYCIFFCIFCNTAHEGERFDILLENEVSDKKFHLLLS